MTSVGGPEAPIVLAQRTARLCAAILDRHDTVPASPFSTAVNIDSIQSHPHLFVAFVDPGDRVTVVDAGHLQSEPGLSCG